MLQCNMLKELQLVKTQRYMLQVLQLLRKQCYMLHGTNNYKWDDTMTNHDSLPLGGGAGVGFTIIATTPVKKMKKKKVPKSLIFKNPVIVLCQSECLNAKGTW